MADSDRKLEKSLKVRILKHVSWNSRRGSSRKGDIINELIFSVWLFFKVKPAGDRELKIYRKNVLNNKLIFRIHPRTLYTNKNF